MSAPSGYTALDFVGFTDKGTYNTSSTYMRNDLVHYGGNIMRCLIDNTKNVTPVVGANWEPWVEASANLVERVIAPLENNPADVAYGVGRQIIYDDWLWEVIAPIAVGDALIDYAVDPTNANIKKSAPVETQLLAVKAEADATDNMIAPTEANASSSSAAYSVGDQLILNNILYDVIAAIQIGDALTTGTGANIAAADTLTDQLNAKANSSDLAPVATSGSYNDLSNKPTLGTAAAKNSTNAVTSGSTDLVESGAVASELATIDSSIQTLTNQVDENTTNIQKLKTKKYIFIMDSYGTFHTDEDNYNYVQLACAMCGLVENTDYFQFYQSGAGFCADAPHQFLSVLQNNESVITDKSSITDIVVFGSANDQLGTYNTIRSGIASFWKYIRNNYPNAKIHIGCISKSIEASTYMNVLPAVYNAYRDSIDFGIEYIDNTEYIMNWLNLYRADALHPTEAAIDVLARYVAQWIKYGHLSIHRKFSSNSILDFTNSPLLDLRPGATQPQILMSQDDGCITAQCANSGILAFCKTKMARTLQPGTTVISSALEVIDSLFYPDSNNSSSWYGSLWHGNDRFGAILTFMTDGIKANNKKIQCQLILENTTGAAVTINADENVSLIFAQPVTYVL